MTLTPFLRRFLPRRHPGSDSVIVTPNCGQPDHVCPRCGGVRTSKGWRRWRRSAGAVFPSARLCKCCHTPVCGLVSLLKVNFTGGLSGVCVGSRVGACSPSGQPIVVNNSTTYDFDGDYYAWPFSSGAANCSYSSGLSNGCPTTSAWQFKNLTTSVIGSIAFSNAGVSLATDGQVLAVDVGGSIGAAICGGTSVVPVQVAAYVYAGGTKYYLGDSIPVNGVCGSVGAGDATNSGTFIVSSVTSTPPVCCPSVCFECATSLTCPCSGSRIPSVIRATTSSITTSLGVCILLQGSTTNYGKITGTTDPNRTIDLLNATGLGPVDGTSTSSCEWLAYVASDWVYSEYASLANCVSAISPTLVVPLSELKYKLIRTGLTTATWNISAGGFSIVGAAPAVGACTIAPLAITDSGCYAYSASHATRAFCANSGGTGIAGTAGSTSYVACP